VTFLLKDKIKMDPGFRRDDDFGSK